MITVMKEIPPHVAGFTASGDVTKTDYEKVLIPRVEEVYKTHGHIHFLFELRTDVGNFTIAPGDFGCSGKLIRINFREQWK